MAGFGGGEMSQLCLTGLRAELCGLMLRGRERGEVGKGKSAQLPPHTPTHIQRHTGVDSGGAPWSPCPR